jgi:AcrR family transcriptional regulator
MTGKRDARRRLLDAAIELIWRGGPAAATPAAIAGRAGAGKMSLYRHFAGGKDELVAEALKEQDARQRAFVLGPPDQAPRDRILEMFDRQAAAADRAGHRYRGCPFIRAQLHLEDDQHPAAPVIAAHKTEMVSDLTDVLREAGLAEPGHTSRVVLMLFDGAAIHAEIAGNGEPFRLARDTVAGLLVDAGTAGSHADHRESPSVRL